MMLNEKLKELDMYPFHMPGHKRNDKYGVIGADIDITEISGFDNLHNPQNCLLELENRYAKLYKSEKSIISINGSTCGILSAISAVCNHGDKIIIARNCHKAVYNACFINKLEVEYITPEINEFGCFDKISQKQIDQSIANNPDAKAIVITSPNYEGIVSDINSPINLIIDAAHGAHFGFYEKLPQYPNADIVISSLHKTLPALTQSAIVNIYNKKHIADVKKYMNIFETSSPSYVLMSSIEKCADFLDNCTDDYQILLDNIQDFKNRVRELDSIEILQNDDFTRLCIKSNRLSGNQLADILRSEHKIEVEMSCNNYVILICTTADDKSAFNRLYNALEQINCKNSEKLQLDKVIEFSLPIKAKECFEIDGGEESDLIDADGFVCSEYVYAYPPGIPIIVPGEVINKKTIETITKSIKKGTNIISESGLLPHKILTNGKV